MKWQRRLNIWFTIGFFATFLLFGVFSFRQSYCRSFEAIIDLYGGFLIIPKFKKQVISDYKELFYKKIDFPDFSASLEVFNENGTKLTVRCGNDKVTALCEVNLVFNNISDTDSRNHTVKNKRNTADDTAWN